MARAPFGIRPRTITGRLLLWHVAAVLGGLLLLGVVVDRALEASFVGQLTDSLRAEALLVQRAVPPGGGDLQGEVRSLGAALGARITIIRTDGVVLADSEHDPATMGNHRTRPEVVQALAGRTGVSSRPSATLGIPFRYVALPPVGGRIVRVALPLTDVHARLAGVRTILAAGFGLAALVGLLVLWVIARGLTRPLRRITEAVQRVGRGDLALEIPEAGTPELADLARTVNHMRIEVSERVEALERERSAREAILATLEEGVLLFAETGEVLYRNEEAERMLGHLDGRDQLTPAALRRTVEEAAAGDGARRHQEVVAGPAGPTLAVTAVAPAGDRRTLLVVRDVTEARAVDAMRRDFVANASHELKTPAASVRALAETISLAAGDDPGSIPRFAAQLEREAERLTRIVSELLDLSRLESEAGERAEVRLDRLVRSEAERIAERGAAAGLDVSISVASPVLVQGSARDLGLLARNLMDNAVRYTRPGGRVEVEVRGEGEAVLVVRDTGLGIPRKDQGRIFERFYRVDRARARETGGTGLGLAIVKHVAENHGGRVEVESRLGQGSTFTVRLPLSESPR